MMIWVSGNLNNFRRYAAIDLMIYSDCPEKWRHSTEFLILEYGTRCSRMGVAEKERIYIK